MIALYAIGFAIIKYDVGWTFIEGFGILPMPWQLWPQKYKAAIFPLDLIFSVAWSFEMVTHLEELCFWLFLVNAVKAGQDWFRSTYFRVWVIGSVVAVAYMPLVTIFTRSDPLKSEAYTFLAGSLGDLSLTLWFIPILWAFPAFLEGMRADGVDMATILRLTKFHELNSIRVVFRFMFTIPLAILGIDGVRPHQHINDHYFWTELLAILAAVGVVVSSGITLVIFFPRSAEGEYATKLAKASMKQSQLRSRRNVELSEVRSMGRDGPTRTWTDDDLERATTPIKVDYDEESTPPSAIFAPNRRLSSGAVARGAVHVSGLTAGNLQRHDAQMAKNPYVHYYTSPIQFMHGE